MIRSPLRTLVAFTALSAGLLAAIAVLATDARADKPKVLVFPGADASTVRPHSDPISKIPPDPPPMVARKQWVFDLRWSKGDPYLLAVHELDLGTAQETQRAMGRFALELFEGPTLIERVRFDFPMLGADEPGGDAGYMGPPSFQKGLTSRIGVMFPQVSRGTRLELWDRATDKRWPLPWPPKGAEDASASAGDAGTRK